MPLPTLDEQRVLISSLAPVRFRRFRSAVGGADRAATELYLLDAQIASHLHATVRFVEIALRERIHRALTAAFGERWFDTQRELFDEDVLEQLDDALERVGTRAPAGKVVAQLMLGTWVSLLGRGDRKPDGTKASYSTTLWDPALQPAFPTRTRRDVHRLALRLNWARNRINHCEPVVFGFPQPGMGEPGVQVRRSPHLILQDARDLTGYLDENLGEWLNRWSEIDTLVRDPRAAVALAYVASEADVVLEQ
jgi:hypothetical protein